MRTDAPWFDVPEKQLEFNLSPLFTGGTHLAPGENVAMAFPEFDSTTIHARISTAGARWTDRRALGRSRDGFTSKFHCLGDDQAHPIEFRLALGLSGGKAYDPLIELPEQAPDALVAETTYDLSRHSSVAPLLRGSRILGKIPHVIRCDPQIAVNLISVN